MYDEKSENYIAHYKLNFFKNDKGILGNISWHFLSARHYSKYFFSLT